VRLIKLAFISITFFALLITGISLFFPSQVTISKAINIGVSRDSILNQIRNIDNWKKWYAGFDTLPLVAVEQKNGNTVSAIITVDGAWINTAERKLTLLPPIAEKVFSEMPVAENFQWM